MSRATFTGLTAARAKLAALAAGLERAASGEVTRAAAAKVQAWLEETAKTKLARHVDSGAAAAGLVVSISGGLVTVTFARYLSYHGWWSFRRGMPAFAVKQASQILAAELFAALRGNRSSFAGDLAGAILDGIADSAAKKAAKAKAPRGRGKALGRG